MWKKWENVRWQKNNQNSEETNNEPTKLNKLNKSAVAENDQKWPKFEAYE